MKNSVMCVKNIGKQYQYGSKDPYQTLAEKITNLMKKPLNKKPVQIVRNSQFWALKGISFDIEAGEVLGVIGRNGAGKSTLLKILSRITSPTEGHVEIKGKIGSLLEVGTGFHPELTGRENIYLSGSILGMKKNEIEQKFDEIIKFSGIEDFLDTSVKRYSSGMYVRLAFAVAAHLDPEILVVDEVLAVGDIAFQKKCIGKMDSIAKEGRTILFVSHNLNSIRMLCNRAILLESGFLVEDGDVGHVIQKYSSSIKVDLNTPHYGNEKLIKIFSIMVNNQSFHQDCNIDEDIYVKIKYLFNHKLDDHCPNFNLFDENGNWIFCSHQLESFNFGNGLIYETQIVIPKNFLQDGVYYLDFALVDPESGIAAVYYKDVKIFNVVETWSLKTTKGKFRLKLPGIVAPLLEYHTICHG